MCIDKTELTYYRYKCDNDKYVQLMAVKYLQVQI